MMKSEETLDKSKRAKNKECQQTRSTTVKLMIGVEIDGVALTGSSNLDEKKFSEHEDVLGFLSTGFKEKQRQHHSLKS